MTHPGDLLASRYRLAHRLATGGMGEVWAGHDETLGRPVAVKVVKREYADDPVFRQRLAAEARAAASVRNPHVVSTYDVGEARLSPTDGAPTTFIVMELLDGHPLSAELSTGSLPPERVSTILADVGDALRAAHDGGVVHRDIKPGNLIAEADGRIIVVDFGIARAAQSAGLTHSGVVLGTARYISPEQAAGKPAVPASDVYSLGVVAYQALTGEPPFVAESEVAVALAHLHDPPRPLPDSVPRPLATLVMRCLDKDPQQRPTAREVSAQARAYLGSPIEALGAAIPTPAGETALVTTQLLEPPSAPPVWLRTRSLVIGGAIATAVIVGLAVADPSGAGGGGQPANAATDRAATSIDAAQNAAHRTPTKHSPAAHVVRRSPSPKSTSHVAARPPTGPAAAHPVGPPKGHGPSAKKPKKPHPGHGKG